MKIVRDTDSTEIIKCPKCGREFEAHYDDLGSYFCPCNKKLDTEGLKKAFEVLGKKYSQYGNNKVRK